MVLPLFLAVGEPLLDGHRERLPVVLQVEGLHRALPFHVTVGSLVSQEGSYPVYFRFVGGYSFPVNSEVFVDGFPPPSELYE